MQIRINFEGVSDRHKIVWEKIHEFFDEYWTECLHLEEKRPIVREYPLCVRTKEWPEHKSTITEKVRLVLYDTKPTMQLTILQSETVENNPVEQP